MANDLEKEAAARSSLRLVEDSQVVGLGTGSTAAYFIQLLGEKVKNGLRFGAFPVPIGRVSRRHGWGFLLPRWMSVAD